MLTQLQQYLRSAASRGRTVTQVGPFLVTVDETTDHPFLNYAVPDPGAAPDGAEVAALAAAMRARGRVPRLEYLEPTASALLPALEAGGFVVEARLQAMAATGPVAVATADGYALVGAPDDDQVAAMLAVQHTAYDLPEEEITSAHVSRTRELQASGGLVVAVRRDRDGAIVGGGVATPPAGSGFTEVAGIAVAQDHRRRGLATALTAHLARLAFAAGVGTAYLTPADDDVARLYARAGFARVGRMLHVRTE